MIALGAQWLKTLHQDHTFSYYPRPLPNHSDEGYRAILAKGRDAGPWAPTPWSTRPAMGRSPTPTSRSS
jgi:hypothetical protein